jgi:uncharacterized protein with FMN-binding domain
MRARIVKPLAALAITGVGSAFVVGFRTSDPSIVASTSTADPAATTDPATTTSQATATSTASASASSAAAATTAPAAVATSTPAATAAASATTGTYADGTYTGSAVSEPWGTFQVQAVISGGKLVDVVLVASPGDGHSSRINSQAVPILTQSAIAAQSAKIDMVSGATWTSQSYVTSLQAALDQAAA